MEDAEEQHPLTLWTRTGTRGRWRPVAAVPTVQAALDLMRGSGDYTVQPRGRDPNLPPGCADDRQADDDEDRPEILEVLR